MITKTNRAPIDGQFVAMWEFESKMWSITFRYNRDGQLQRYSDEEDAWVEHEGGINVPGNAWFYYSLQRI
jgi:hypothetical protein